MMYATCAHPQCYGKIAYNPDMNVARPRYCHSHMIALSDRLGVKPDFKDDQRLWILPTRIRNAKPEISGPEPEVIMICIACKRRTTWKKERWLTGDIPECCKRKMIYHKDAELKIKGD